MKKTTSENLTQKLAKYGTLTLALAGLTDATGQIVYTDIDPDSAGTTNLNNTPITINMDNNGDFEFDIRLKYTVGLYITPNSLISGASVLGNSMGGPVDNYNYPFALNNGFVISSGNTNWINSASQTMVYNNCIYGNGSDYNQWCDVTDKYLGLRFQIAGQTHYGWARLDVGDLPDNWIIKDYAYNSVAGAPIMAGQTVLGVEDNFFSNVAVKAFNKSVSLYNLPNRTNYQMFNLSGQSVLNGKTSSTNHTIDANTLSNGIYIIELMDADSKAVFRKKIVL